MRPIRGRRVALALLALPLAASLAGCGGAQNDAKAGRADGAGGTSAVAPGSRSADLSAADGVTGDAQDVKTTAAIERSVIATGSLRLTTRHLDDVRRDAIALVTGLGGNVDHEQSRSDAHGNLDRVDLTLRVPASSFDKALDQLGALGTVRDREQSVEDVTTQVIDIDARVKAQTESVASIQRLLARARTIAEIMSIESQLASRQAELDSLKQQQKWLADQTSLSTVQLSVTRPGNHDAQTSSGFLGGLERGWNALSTSTVALATAVGAVLPFAVVLVVLGIPVWLLVRRRRHPAAMAPTPET
jgi:hypothetical protein